MQKSILRKSRTSGVPARIRGRSVFFAYSIAWGVCSTAMPTISGCVPDGGASKRSHLWVALLGVRRRALLDCFEHAVEVVDVVEGHLERDKGAGKTDAGANRSDAVVVEVVGVARQTQCRTTRRKEQASAGQFRHLGNDEEAHASVALRAPGFTERKCPREVGPQRFVEGVFGAVQIGVLPTQRFGNAEAGVGNHDLHEPACAAGIHDLRGNNAAEGIFAVLDDVPEQLDEHVMQCVSRFRDVFVGDDQPDDSACKRLVAVPATKAGELHRSPRLSSRGRRAAFDNLLEAERVGEARHRIIAEIHLDGSVGQARKDGEAGQCPDLSDVDGVEIDDRAITDELEECRRVVEGECGHENLAL